MRVVTDMQACQSEVSAGRGVGRYACSLAGSMAREPGDDDLRLCFNTAYSETLHETLDGFAGAPGRVRLSGYAAPAMPASRGGSDGARAASQALVRHHWMSLGPDVIHVAHVFEGFDGLAVIPEQMPEAPGLVRSATLYDLIPLRFADRYLTEPSRRAWYERQCELLRNCDCLLAISEATRRDAIDLLGVDPARVFAVHGGVEPHFRPQRPPPDVVASLERRLGIRRRVVLYTGGDDYRKNLEGAVTGYATLPARLRADTQLVIACSISPSTRTALMAAARRNGLADDALVLTGFVAEADLAALYATCAAFVFPSLYEGLGLPVLEAMASGAPVIGADNSGVTEVIGRSDALFDPRSAEAMAERLAAVLDDAGFARALREHGIEQAGQYTWKRSASLAWEALREAHQRARPREAARASARAPKTDSRSRLALFTPLPPCRTGIANYSAALLPHLEQHFAIDIFIDDYEPDPAIRSRYSILPHRDFPSRRREYDAILYEVGNSEFHAYMLDAIERYPGVVMLHDAYLSGLYGWVDFQLGRRGTYRDAVLYAHGPRARRRIAPVQKNPDPVRASMVELPASKAIIDAAIGVISHTPFNLELAREAYPEGWRAPYRIIPHLRHLPPMSDAGERSALRARLGFGADDFLVCTFGHITWTKSGDVVFDAFARSPLARDPRARLVYVGELGRDAFGLELVRAIEASPLRERIRITGYASEQDYAAYLGVADVAVQLRTRTRGGTSGALLGALAHGVPVIANESGSFVDYPARVVRLISADAGATELAAALAELHGSGEVRAALATAAREHVARVHDPDIIAAEYASTIASFSAHARADSLVSTVRELGRCLQPQAPAEAAARYASALHQSMAQPSFQRQRILVDVSHISDVDHQTGIQRVVRNIVRWLYCSDRAGFEAVAVRIVDGALAEASDWLRAEGLIDFAEPPQERIEPRWGDTLLMLDSSWNKIDAMRPVFDAVHRAFGTVVTVVYDILPVRFPDAFIEGGAAWFSGWLDKALAVSDGCLCISAAVADELQAYAKERGVRLPTRIGVFHLGADLPVENGRVMTERVRQATAMRTLLMVGTLEPRKNHALVLDAFERLWSRGIDAGLCVAGKPGWNVAGLTERLRGHMENGRRLFIIDDPSDDELAALYRGCAGMMLASRGEGFGLPLIEAAQFGTPIIASDIPVFREVAGTHASYFALGSADALADALQSWLATPRSALPASSPMPRLTWEQSASRLLEILLDECWTRSGSPHG
jgi:glycosyltransferase involved in cell wall biosynthesis